MRGEDGEGEEGEGGRKEGVLVCVLCTVVSACAYRVTHTVFREWGSLSATFSCGRSSLLPKRWGTQWSQTLTTSWAPTVSGARVLTA